MRYSWIYVVLIVGISLGGTGSLSLAAADGSVRSVQAFKVPVEAPDFTLKDLNGHNVTLSSLKGKFVLINFFTTW